MSKIVSVSQLKSGDRFAFLNGPSSGASSPLNEESKTVYVVTRPPAVNLAANTCFFRYQPADMSEADVAHGAASRSFNGLPELKVAIPGAEPDQPPTATKTAAVKLAGQTDLAPPAKFVTRPAAGPLTATNATTPNEAEAPRAAAAKIHVPSSTAKRAVDFSSSDRVEPRQAVAILPALTKASKSVPAVKNTAVKKSAAKEPDHEEAGTPPAKKSVEKKSAEKKSAAKKPAKKAAPKKAAAKTAKKK